jgi:hypothetical protein
MSMVELQPNFGAAEPSIHSEQHYKGPYTSVTASAVGQPRIVSSSDSTKHAHTSVAAAKFSPHKLGAYGIV